MIRRIGIDIGGHTISAGELLSDGGSPLPAALTTVCTPQERDMGSLLSAVRDLVLQRVPRGSRCFVGVWVPGFVNRERSVILRLTNFRGCDGIPAALMISEDLRSHGVYADVRMENDANCAALGEHICGTARGMKDFVVMTLGTGIGAGLVANGRLITGAHGMAGECGHLAVCSEDLYHSCMCGGAGHLEEAASAGWLEKKALENGLPADFRAIWEMRRQNDAAKAITEESLNAVARGISSICVTLDPEAVILSGGMSRAAGIAEELRARVMKYLPLPMRSVFKLLLSELGSSAAVAGAAALDDSL
ncbi:MAG: ROK family protein [Synergistes sp.]|nr:ROK family protein [Synergistes sp.]